MKGGIGEDYEGKMIELDAKAVLSIPRKIKCQEVVRHGFMSNFLFANITNIFGAPSIVKEMLEKLPTAHEEKGKKRNDALDGISNVSVDDNGDVVISKEIVIGTAQEVIKKIETHKAEKEKKSIEDDVRSHLRGFARTIPSFIMAYGDENLTLANFDDYTEDDVFAEVTGITEENFRFLRDGGDYVDEATGVTEHFEGHLFDEVVFNDSIREFLNKRRELANYFDESQEEDIFDYIPPQRTNQIFTPRWVVSKMVDELEKSNPGCFDDPSKTFADLYMKSGLYITEIVKRLFRSESMKSEIPDDNERIRHILTKQVYGMAPTRIIFLIATNYILGFDPDLKVETNHFVEADAAAASKEGNLQELADECWGD